MKNNPEKNTVNFPENSHNELFKIEEHSYWFAHRANCIKYFALKYLKNKEFFDIGGGNGYIAKILQDAGIHSTLVEPGQDACNNAKQRGVKNIICSTFFSANIQENSIPAVGLFDVLEHIEDEQEFLEKIYGKIEQNGFLLLTVPAYSFLWSQEDKLACHFRRYNLKDVEDKLKKAGFDIVFSSYIFALLVLPVYIFRVMPSILGLYKPDYKTQFAVNKSKLNNSISSLLNLELSIIKKGFKIPFGSSCLILAQKTKGQCL